MLIYGDKQDIENSQNNQCNPTILYCNPNAGYYETLYFDSQWIEFYTQKGMNLMLWNYRGYGFSQGNPNPKDIFSDGEIIIKYLREEEKLNKIGTHGQSLGGMISCYLAQKVKLDFLCADRTFSCISDIAYFGFAKWTKFLIKILAKDLDIWSPKNYSDSNCYKIITYDVNDNIIPYMASLKNGIIKQVSFKIFKIYLKH
ncbi:hypothetical protein IMG5_065700 [Ichthyophthirius multifiliis]|uniref:Serine aminopeptidase S33 domain-containing protein n=1 Tax=Ichthyophthirius multifiliis TaxID=5932 RepID=G0QP95_ICHMU|nr:hypothetical protein IMG5_065700 [Ichthyophthirius multifiliis]EGR32957.1 hypothetical protein IMG5_065700 [Ichthyophthirius multifiliis]|eukprot:XP_004036943.1 hypothetical protein IMG5_065700 [Ichthyophthirius multifiliis]